MAACLLGLFGCGPRDFYEALEVDIVVPSPLVADRVRAGWFVPRPLGETGPSLEADLTDGRVRLSDEGGLAEASLFLLPTEAVVLDGTRATFAVPAVDVATAFIPVVWYDDDEDDVLDIGRPGGYPERARVPFLQRDDERFYLTSYRAIPELEMVEARAVSATGREIRVTDDDRERFSVALAATPDAP